ncbi:hypothetical protein AVEN_220201-1 [Araneus ventricosus]|uniref:Uncharacterized protein n=1 Tax=Araneus ventricosus TaxID=182803 RepID=A0A4Y2GZL8_ARAVE|nr:hypothetical protein AVEN_220201-1 [Araneus ventricosus]
MADTLAKSAIEDEEVPQYLIPLPRSSAKNYSGIGPWPNGKDSGGSMNMAVRRNPKGQQQKPQLASPAYTIYHWP